MLEVLGVRATRCRRSSVLGCRRHVRAVRFLGREIPIAGIAGDQHAALFGQCCFRRGMAKNTYGTGCFVLMNTGEKPVFFRSGADYDDRLADRRRGRLRARGQRLQRGLGDQMAARRARSDRIAAGGGPPRRSGARCGRRGVRPGVYGSPARRTGTCTRGALLGVTRGTSKAHLCRAVLESIAYESLDLFRAMEAGSGVQISELRVDGGASRSRFLMQYQADILHCAVRQPVCLETTALGSAMLARLAVGVWDSLEGFRRSGSSGTRMRRRSSRARRPQRCGAGTRRWSAAEIGTTRNKTRRSPAHHVDSGVQAVWARSA